MSDKKEAPSRAPRAPANPYVSDVIIDYVPQGAFEPSAWPAVLMFIPGSQTVVVEPGGQKVGKTGYWQTQPPFKRVEIPVAQLWQLFDQLERPDA